MSFRILLCVFALAAAAYAKEPKAFQTGKLLKMDSVKCGTDEKDAQTLAGEITGSDSGHRKTHELLCQEYVLQGEKVVYLIRPRDEKHATLLPIGEFAQFRMEKDKMRLRVEGSDSKEREFSVVSMTPRTDSNTADVVAPRLNHLQ